jgi:hypothetical protein
MVARLKIVVASRPSLTIPSWLLPLLLYPISLSQPQLFLFLWSHACHGFLISGRTLSVRYIRSDCGHTMLCYCTDVDEIAVMREIAAHRIPDSAAISIFLRCSAPRLDIVNCKLYGRHNAARTTPTGSRAKYSAVLEYQSNKRKP